MLNKTQFLGMQLYGPAQSELTKLVSTRKNLRISFFSLFLPRRGRNQSVQKDTIPYFPTLFLRVNLLDCCALSPSFPIFNVYSFAAINHTKMTTIAFGFELINSVHFVAHPSRFRCIYARSPIDSSSKNSIFYRPTT